MTHDLTNALYYGDNLTVLREHVPDEELLAGNGFQMPAHQPMYQPARRIARPEGEQGQLA